MTADGGRRRASEGRLVDRPEFFERLVRSTSDAVVAFDVDGTVLFANDASVHVFGCGPARLVGTDVAALLPDRFRDWFRESLRNYVETGRRSFDWNGAEFVIEREDGTELPVSCTLAEHVHDGRRVFSAIVRDVSASVERREELARRLGAADQWPPDPADLRHRLAEARTAIDRARARLAGGQGATDSTPRSRAVPDADGASDVRDPASGKRGAAPDPDAALETARAALDDLGASLPDGDDAGTERERRSDHGRAEHSRSERGRRGADRAGPRSADGPDGGREPGDHGVDGDSAPVSLSDVAAEAWDEATAATGLTTPGAADAMLRVDGFGAVDAPSDTLGRVLSGCFRVALRRGDPTVHVGPLDALAEDGDSAGTPAAAPGDWTADATATEGVTPADRTGAGFYVSVDANPSGDRLGTGDAGPGPGVDAADHGLQATAVAAAIRAAAPSSWDVAVRRSVGGDVRVAVRPG